MPLPPRDLLELPSLNARVAWDIAAARIERDGRPLQANEAGAASARSRPVFHCPEGKGEKEQLFARGHRSAAPFQTLGESEMGKEPCGDLSRRVHMRAQVTDGTRKISCMTTGA